MRVLGLVPARAGSKGIPGKNLRELGDRPLLAWTAATATAAERLDRLVLSTEAEAIAEVGRRLGLETPFLRPAELAADDTPMLAVVTHALATLAEQGDDYDAVCLLQPTSPFRREGLVDECVERLEGSGADAVVTVAPVPDEYNPHWVFETDDSGHLRLATGDIEPIPRRQDLPPTVHRDGSVYVTRTETVRSGSLYGPRLVGVRVDPTTTVNLDDEADWERAEALVAQRDG
jgi:CMP-N-acetylneuraminic acid synthetase